LRKVNAKEVQSAYLAGLHGTFAEVQKTNDFIREYLRNAAHNLS
jgi:hypothetical protein